MEIFARLSSALALALLAGCNAPAGDEAAKAPAPAATTAYATVLEAPVPDYTALAAHAVIVPRGALRREATGDVPANAREVGRRWIERLDEMDALGGYGLAGKGDDGPVVLVDTVLTARDFDALAVRNGWRVPDWIDWGFVPELVAPEVTKAAAPAIRFWPASKVRTGMQLEALLAGRVFIRDGCFFVRQGEAPEKLAWFHAETGLARDSEGYLVLVDRVTGEQRARVGEQMSWAGPNDVDPDDERVRTYRQACGGAEVVNVGNPEASERMYVRYPDLRDPAPPPPPPPHAD